MVEKIKKTVSIRVEYYVDVEVTVPAFERDLLIEECLNDNNYLLFKPDIKKYGENIEERIQEYLKAKQVNYPEMVEMTALKQLEKNIAEGFTEHIDNGYGSLYALEYGTEI